MAQGWEGCIHTWLLGSEGIHVCAASSSCPAVAECCSMAPGSAVPMHCWLSPSLLPCPFSWVCTDQLASQRSEEPEGRVRTPKQLNLSLRPSVKLSPREPLMIKWAQKAFKQYIKATRTSFFDRILFEVDNAEALGFFFFFFLVHSLLFFCCCTAWEYNMLLCDGRRCSRSVPITFRNRKNTMYREQDYFCEPLLQLCRSESFKHV